MTVYMHSNTAAHKQASSLKCHSADHEATSVLRCSLCSIVEKLINIPYITVLVFLCRCLFLSLSRYGHGFEMFCLASDAARTVVASACKVVSHHSRLAFSRAIHPGFSHQPFCSTVPELLTIESISVIDTYGGKSQFPCLSLANIDSLNEIIV